MFTEIFNFFFKKEGFPALVPNWRVIPHKPIAYHTHVTPSPVVIKFLHADCHCLSYITFALYAVSDVMLPSSYKVHIINQCTGGDVLCSVRQSVPLSIDLATSFSVST